MVSFETILTRADLITVLNRHLSVRVLDVSATGCLLEADCEVVVGTVGALSLEHDGREYSDPIKVTRAQPIPGGGQRHLLGAEFVWLTLPAPGSVRRLARQVTRIAPDLAAKPAWRQSGSPGGTAGAPDRRTGPAGSLETGHSPNAGETSRHATHTAPGEREEPGTAGDASSCSTSIQS
jgi:hypothetical protein